MDQQAIFLTICGMALATYATRAIPLVLLSRRRLSEGVIRFLRYVPAAVLSALLMPSLLVGGGGLDLGPDNLFLWAAIPTALLAVTTRSFFGSVALGMGLVAAARFYWGG